MLNVAIYYLHFLFFIIKPRIWEVIVTSYPSPRLPDRVYTSGLELASPTPLCRVCEDALHLTRAALTDPALEIAVKADIKLACSFTGFLHKQVCAVRYPNFVRFSCRGDVSYWNCIRSTSLSITQSMNFATLSL